MFHHFSFSFYIYNEWFNPDQFSYKNEKIFWITDEKSIGSSVTPTHLEHKSLLALYSERLSVNSTNSSWVFCPMWPMKTIWSLFENIPSLFQSFSYNAACGALSFLITLLSLNLARDVLCINIATAGPQKTSADMEFKHSRCMSLLE